MNNTIHSSDDFEGMRKAGNLAASTLDLLVEKVKPGVSTEELDNIAFDYIVRHDELYNQMQYYLTLQWKHLVLLFQQEDPM